MKLEDPPTPAKISALLARAPGTNVFGGLGGAASYFELSRGAVGTMTGFSYPEVLTSLRAADRAAAYATFTRYLPLLTFEAQPGWGSVSGRSCYGDVVPSLTGPPGSATRRPPSCSRSSTLSTCSRPSSRSSHDPPMIRSRG